MECSHDAALESMAKEMRLLMQSSTMHQQQSSSVHHNTKDPYEASEPFKIPINLMGTRFKIYLSSSIQF